MEKLIIKQYNDFAEIVYKLKQNREIEIDLKNVNYKLKTRILDLIAGYIYEQGKLQKINSNIFKVVK